jgi:hypothetical protein
MKNGGKGIVSGRRIRIPVFTSKTVLSGPAANGRDRSAAMATVSSRTSLERKPASAAASAFEMPAPTPCEGYRFEDREFRAYPE